jgi:glycosyltransferase involved in cell wall biosynthesis
MAGPDRKVKLIIQIPCYNEEETLPATLADLPRELPGVDVIEWLVIDDGSADRTAEVARELGVDHIVRHNSNQGLAAAFLTGLDASLAAGATVVVNTDADNQYDASCISDLVRPVLEHGADLVVGERPIEQIEEFSRLKKRLQRTGSWVVRRFSGTSVRDAASGFRAMSREAALRLQVFGRYSYTMETLVQARAEGLNVTSVPIRVNPHTRPSRLAKSTAQYVRRSAQTIVRSFAIYYPFRFFLVIGLLPFLVGFVLLVRWFGFFVFAEEYQSRLPSLIVGGVFILVSVQIWMVGFLGDLQAATRRLVVENRVSERRVALDREHTE